MRYDKPRLQNIPMPGTPPSLEFRREVLGVLSDSFGWHLNPNGGYLPLLDIDYASIEREWAAKITAACPVGSKRQVCTALHNANARTHE